MRQLNELRNGFIHFGPRAWSIQLTALPLICLPCVEIAEHLGWKSGVVSWQSAAQWQQREKRRTIADSGSQPSH
jgi:hypothetical protein